MADTTLSRSLVVELQRKTSGETVDDFNHLDNEDFAVIRRKLLRWAADNAERLYKATPADPPGFENRLRMNWH